MNATTQTEHAATQAAHATHTAPHTVSADHKNAVWHARRLAATPRGVGVMGDFFIAHAKNSEFWDIEGRRFIDFAGGIAVLNTGHSHPKIQAAIAAQLERFTHSCYQVVPYTEYVALAERINAIVPIAGPKKTAFFYRCGSGRKRHQNRPSLDRPQRRDRLWWRFSWPQHVCRCNDRQGSALQGRIWPVPA